MTYTPAEFARLCGVKPPNITQMVKRGRLIKNVDGLIDDANAVNRLYIEGKTGKVKKNAPKGLPTGKTKTPRKPNESRALVIRQTIEDADRGEAETPRAESVDGEVEDGEETEEDLKAQLDELLKGGGQALLLLKKLKADIRYKEKAAERYELEIETKKKNLVEKAQVVAVIQGINKAIDDHFHRLPAKLGPVIFAKSRIDGATELEVIREIEVQMGEATRRALEDVCRLG